MKNAKKIKLTKLQTFWHYSVVPFMLIVPIITTWNLIKYFLLNTYTGVREPNELLSGYFFLIPAVFFYFLQRRRLRFKEFKIENITITDLKTAFEKTVEERGWERVEMKGGYIRARRRWKLSTGGGSWGELITIIKDGDTILINSICDPDGYFASVASWGQNKKNVKTFIKNLTLENV